MKHVGEALQGATSTTYCIGIATWGIINDRKRLKNLDTGCIASVDYHVSNSMMTRGASLDHNHSHFILVDKGQINQYGDEINLRGSIEQAICNMKIEKSECDTTFLWLIVGIHLLPSPQCIHQYIIVLIHNL